MNGRFVVGFVLLVGALCLRFAWLPAWPAWYLWLDISTFAMFIAGLLLLGPSLARILRSDAVPRAETRVGRPFTHAVVVFAPRHRFDACCSVCYAKLCFKETKADDEGPNVGAFEVIAVCPNGHGESSVYWEALKG